MSAKDLQPYAPELPEPAGDSDLSIQALEELYQLGYVVRDGLLYPPDRAQPAGDPGMPCGHQRSLMLKSVETGADLYCELCDTRGRRNDAEQREAELQAAIAARDAHMSSMRAEITEARITIAELKADLRERDERIAIIRTEWAAEVAALTQRARSLDWNKEFEENVGRPPTDEDRKLMGVSE